MAKNDGFHKTHKSVQTKNHITSAFLALMQNKKWDKISVIEICRKAEITRGTFYQYFGDIYDLMEQLEQALLADLQARYAACVPKKQEMPASDQFLEKFDYSPPRIFTVWFEFCQTHQEAMLPLLDRKYGDTYFVKKLKGMIREYIEEMMDYEGTAKDELRSHFVEVFVELHLLSVQTWLSSDTEEALVVDDIVNLLNTMRVGSMYLTWKRSTDPDFEEKMRGNGLL